MASIQDIKKKGAAMGKGAASAANVSAKGTDFNIAAALMKSMTNNGMTQAEIQAALNQSKEAGI